MSHVMRRSKNSRTYMYGLDGHLCRTKDIHIWRMFLVRRVSEIYDVQFRTILKEFKDSVQMQHRKEVKSERKKERKSQPDCRCGT